MIQNELKNVKGMIKENEKQMTKIEENVDYNKCGDILKNFKDYGSSKAQKQWRKIKQNFEHAKI
jgi:hypothetical protein